MTTAEIRERHESANNERTSRSFGTDAHKDRGILLDRLEAEEIEGNRSEDYLNSDDVIEVIRQLNLAESTIKAISELPDKWREDCCVSIGMVKLAVELKADELQAIIKGNNDGVE